MSPILQRTTFAMLVTPFAASCSSGVDGDYALCGLDGPLAAGTSVKVWVGSDYDPERACQRKVTDGVEVRSSRPGVADLSAEDRTWMLRADSAGETRLSVSVGRVDDVVARDVRVAEVAAWSLGFPRDGTTIAPISGLKVLSESTCPLTFTARDAGEVELDGRFSAPWSLDPVRLGRVVKEDEDRALVIETGVDAGAAELVAPWGGRASVRVVDDEQLVRMVLSDPQQGRFGAFETVEDGGTLRMQRGDTVEVALDLRDEANERIWCTPREGYVVRTEDAEVDGIKLLQIDATDALQPRLRVQAKRPGFGHITISARGVTIDVDVVVD